MNKVVKFQRGNIFFALFGAVAFIGVLGAATMSFMKGPLKTSVTLSRISVADTQMQVAAQMAVIQASGESDFGDCDGDGFVEPIEFKTQADVSLKPVGGGNIPNTLGATKQDPWGTLYGYCVWNNGSNITINDVGACDDDGSGTEQRIEGSSQNYHTVMAIVSAGPDRVFQTTCQSFDAADADDNGALGDVGDSNMAFKTSGSDDFILTYSYVEAADMGGDGLWSIKSSDPGTAIINKAIEFSGGLTMGTDSDVTVCDPSTANVMRFNPFNDAIEVCDGAGNWNPTSGSAETFTNENGVACDGSILGQVRFNTTTSLPQFCDGTNWRSFNLSASTSADLELLPSTSNSMDVDGADNKDSGTCTAPWSCGDEVTFTLQNLGASDSSPIVWSFENSKYFAVTSENCTGQVLSQMDACTINVRPRANGTTSYSTRLNVTSNNAPFTVLQGTATNFGCNVGVQAAGGFYVACGQNDGDGAYDLVVIPSGCNGAVSNPTCSGTDGAAVLKTWGPNGTLEHLCYNSDTSCPPAEQHETIMLYRNYTGLSFPAAEYCDAMDLNGYTDWFLPTREQLRISIMPKANSGVLTGFSSTYYVSSSPHDYDEYDLIRRDGNSADYYRTSSSYYVRCVRRDNLAMPGSSITDTNPKDKSGYSPGVTFTSGARMTSGNITVEEILQDISVSITGTDGSPAILHNGVDVGTSVSGVGWGDTIALEMDAPTVLGDQYSLNVDIGGDNYTWWTGYADSSVTAKVFVTDKQYNDGNFGGQSGADADCSAEADLSSIGLSGTWKAIISSSSVSAVNHIPWNWGTLEDVNGNVVANAGINDLFDGSIQTGISLDQHATVETGYVFTGSTQYGTTYAGVSSVTTCEDWTTTTYSKDARIGAVGSTDFNWVNRGYGECDDNYHLYCIEDIDDVSDTTPATFSPEYKIQVATSSREISESITIGGMSGGAAPTMSVAATGGTPTFTVNGGAEVSSATISNGDVIVFYMTSAATGNTTQTMTIIADAMTTYWRVWTGDPTGSKVNRVFVTSSNYNGTFGGVIGADSTCQSVADGATLGGTWKAMLSGITESEWAVNRVGYDWSTLELVDGTDVVLAPNLWKSNTSSWLSSIKKDQNSTNRINQTVHSNMTADGHARSSSSNSTYNCYNWTSTSGGSHTVYRGNTSGTTWPNTFGVGYWVSGCSARLYCIEQ
ncbi:MAG: DUF1566 domain-containing protein [Alphaproteobacteria bacterium]|nr:DUF1566 domain-containing protein [Alphaproteobacteria bacterium]